jgi:hypothetical protein
MSFNESMCTTFNTNNTCTIISCGNYYLLYFFNKLISLIYLFLYINYLSEPKLSLAKCRKNVENFIEACRQLGLNEVII